MKDKNWDFERKVSTDLKISWSDLLEEYNKMQDSQADLYMVVSKLERPEGLNKWKMRFKQFRYSGSQEFVFKHRKVYIWFQKLAYNLDLTLGETLVKWYRQRSEIRSELELGETVSVNINSLDSMNTEDSKVSEQELQELIEDD